MIKGRRGAVVSTNAAGGCTNLLDLTLLGGNKTEAFLQAFAADNFSVAAAFSGCTWWSASHGYG